MLQKQTDLFLTDPAITKVNLINEIPVKRMSVGMSPNLTVLSLR